MTAGALRRTIRRAAERAARVECCGLCAGAVGPEHRHLLDEQDGTLMCACTPCSLLFDRDAAGGVRYRLVPTHRTRLAEVPVEPLNVPVGLAFFVKQGNGRVVAHYPGPLGTTQSEVTASAWRSVEARSPALSELRPLVEGFLIWTGYRSGRDQHWIVPVEDCYRLVAVIRQNWGGLSGGSNVWREIARFFDDLGRRVADPRMTFEEGGAGMGEIRVGKPDVELDAPAHTKGVEEGNSVRRRQAGHHADGTVDARRSTGIQPKKHDPILPIMPNLPPG